MYTPHPQDINTVIINVVTVGSGSGDGIDSTEITFGIIEPDVSASISTEKHM